MITCKSVGYMVLCTGIADLNEYEVYWQNETKYAYKISHPTITMGFINAIAQASSVVWGLGRHERTNKTKTIQ